MSTKPKRSSKAGKKVEKPAKVERPKVVPPTGRAPHPVVLSRHSGDMVQRDGRGFSEGELVGAGLPLVLAKRFGVQIDSRRKSVLDANVASISKWYSPPRKSESEVGVKTKEKPAAKKGTRTKKGAS